MASSPTNVDKAHKKSIAHARTHCTKQRKAWPGRSTGLGTTHRAASSSVRRALRTVPGDETRGPEIKALRSAQTRRTPR
eukprot:287252-Hanusia_phi.AAC.1